ncbi:zinc finger protein 667-like isoform X2 [Tiliqua scincoides]|uniref:zinc finger protein 667-like isoform X2 n=1 Tax=Tiliqua scincoides TaxID=71010 RepID=UPI003461CAD3
MPGGRSSQALVRFEDVIVTFSREEWKILKEWQKELYWEVLKDTYKALLLAGSPVTRSGVLAWFEQCEHQNLKGTQKSRNGDSSDSSCTSNDQPTKRCREECAEQVGHFSLVHGRSEEVTAQHGNVGGAPELLHMSVMQQESPLRAELLPQAEYRKSIQELAQFAYSPRTVTVSKPFGHSECGKRFQRKWLPQVRQKIDTKNVSFRCPECGVGFPSNSQLRMHWRVHIHAGTDGRKTSPSLEPGQPVHPQESRAGEKLHLCALCGKSFQRYLSFLQHQKGHDEAGPQPCAQCEVVFMFQSDLEIHEESHLEEVLGAQATCGTNCICDISLQLHFASQLRKCVESSQFGLQSHEQLHQKVRCKEKPYSCGQCEQRFTLEVNLEAHYRYRHKEWLLKHQLNCCVPNCLLQHRKVQTKQKSPRSAPSDGSIGFRSSGLPSCTLRSCSYCGKWFVSKFRLRKHQKRHNHGGAAKRDQKMGFMGGFGGPPLAHVIKKLHSCQECGKKFVYKWQRDAHLKGHAREKQPLSLHRENVLVHEMVLGQHHQVPAKRGASKNGKRGQRCAEEQLCLCEECGKVFRKNYLPVHQAFHAGLRHKCLLCEKIFNFRSGAIRHLRRHWQKGDFSPCLEGKKRGSSRPCVCMIERISMGPQHKQQNAVDRVPRPSEGSPTKNLHAVHGQSLGSDCGLGVQPHGPLRGQQEDQVEHEQRCDWKLKLQQYQNSVLRQFKCPDCEKEFAHMAFLMMHRRTHKSKQLYQCTECGKNFISSFYLGLHRKRHVKESA